ncbi:MAG TPA: GNAT family N-acetyltransferase [Firmicutes bacterium]|nr:GNAT family N-acetyltransferase [Bacillota bacterium]
MAEAEVRFSNPEARQVLVQVLVPPDLQEASRLIIHDLPMMVEGTVLRMGGIGGVQTVPQLRRQGYARQMLSSAVQYMRENDYDVSVLFGIHNFYHRFGFVTSLIESRITVPTRLAENAAGSRINATASAEVNTTTGAGADATALLSIRPYDPERDLDAVLRLYVAKNAHRVGPLLRSPDRWWGFRLGSTWGRQTDVFVAVREKPNEKENGKGEELVGYFLLDRADEEVTVPEVEAVDAATLEAILAHLARLAVERRVDHLTFHIHPDADMARLLRFYGSEVTVTYSFDRGPMARIINLESTLRKLLPVLNRRLAQGAAAPGAAAARADATAGAAGATGVDATAPATPTASGVTPATAATPSAVKAGDVPGVGAGTEPQGRFSGERFELGLVIWDANSARPDLSSPGAGAHWQAVRLRFGLTGTPDSSRWAAPAIVIEEVEAAGSGIQAAQDTSGPAPAAEASLPPSSVERVVHRLVQEGVAAVSLPQELFTQLLLGYRSVDEVFEAKAVRITETPAAVRELFALLFPPRQPYLPRADRF